MAESDTVRQIRQKLFSYGDAGFMKIFGVCQKIIKGNIYKLTLEEFEQCLKIAGLWLEPEEVAAVFKEFDRDGSGIMDLNEFFLTLRPPMSEYRKEVLIEVFQKIDKTGDGLMSIKVTQEEFLQAYTIMSDAIKGDWAFVSMMERAWKVKVDVNKMED